MRAIDVFKARHQFAREIFYDDLWERYDEATLRTPAHPTTNTLLWLFWHIARVEDAGVTRFVTREEQVLHRDNWNAKLGTDVTHFGFGCTREKMLAVSAQLDVGAVRDYWHAVIEYVFAAVDRVPPETLDEVLSDEAVRVVLADEGVAPSAQVVAETVPIYSGWTRLEALYHFSTTHYYWHGGEVRTLEGILRGE